MVFCYCFETEEMKTVGVEKTCYMSFFYVEIYCKITLKIHLFYVFIYSLLYIYIYIYIYISDCFVSVRFILKY